VVTGTTISSTMFNAFTSDVATGLSTAVCKDGQQTITANIPMGSFKLTGLAAGSAAGNSLRYEQLFTTSAVQLLGSMEWVKGADVASATTTNLTTATGNAVHITGTTAITAVTLGSGMWRLVIFDGILTLTHHATNNNLPGAANITTAAGDRALYWSDGTTVYCISYIRAATGATPTKQPTRTVLTSGSSATYTTPSGATRIVVQVIGGGGAGAGGTANAGATGNASSFSTLTANGGAGGNANAGSGGAGGTASGGDINITGGGGGGGGVTNAPGGTGGNSVLGGGAVGVGAGNAGATAAANSGGGGGGGAAAGSNSGGGGGSGGYAAKLLTAPSTTYTYTVGAASTGGAAGGQPGGNGAAGQIIVDEFYN
jgi:hypothetical protein